MHICKALIVVHSSSAVEESRGSSINVSNRTYQINPTRGNARTLKNSYKLILFNTSSIERLKANRYYYINQF